MMQRRRRIIKIAASLFIVLLVQFTWALFQLFPRNFDWNDFFPYLAHIEHPPVNSPDGSRVLSIRINDAGGMHIGDHYVWIEEHSWLTGKRVVSTGYVEWSDTPPTIDWISNNVIEITYMNGRVEVELD